MSNAAAKQEMTAAPIVQPSEATAIIAMIERAATNPAVDIDKMERLMKMHTDMLARNAKAAYSAALAAMQPTLPVITKRGKIGLGGKDNTKGPTYALWEDINDAIRPHLAEHGFALSFRTGREGDKISVTGILSHRDGHSEETTMQLPIDTGPGRNAVQSVGSSTSYGKRYTASALLNLTTRGEDDDGNKAVGSFITEEQLIVLRDLIEAKSADQPAFLKFFKIAALADLPSSRLAEATAMLNAKKARA